MKARTWILFLAVVAATVFSYVVGDPPVKQGSAFMFPELARVIFFHLPCAFLTAGLVFLGAWFSLKYLQTKDVRWDIRHGAVTELGMALGVATMLTGILFSKVQWNAWWSWDPRQTSFLMVLFLFSAALALRGGLTDEHKRAKASAAYALATLLPVLFLIFVFPRLAQIHEDSLHPTASSVEAGKQLFDATYRTGLIAVLVALGWLSSVLYKVRVRAGLLELELENLDGLDETGSGDSAPHRVVRPVGISSER